MWHMIYASGQSWCQLNIHFCHLFGWVVITEQAVYSKDLLANHIDLELNLPFIERKLHTETCAGLWHSAGRILNTCSAQSSRVRDLKYMVITVDHGMEESLPRSISGYLGDNSPPRSLGLLLLELWGWVQCILGRPVTPAREKQAPAHCKIHPRKSARFCLRETAWTADVQYTLNFC